jgi:hypothetical protein
MYNSFINKYKNQIIKDDYFEMHHIKPRYLGGCNSEENLIKLTYRQHILAHLLLWRKYKNPEDMCAYRLMKGLSKDRKSEICKMIGEKNKISGHIYKLGLKNKETNWINKIKTKESLSKGGKIAGKIAKETGQINKIKTNNSCKKGGITQGNKAKELGQIQQIAKYKGKYVLIMPDGKEFLHAFQASEYMNVDSNTISQRCYSGALGYKRRLKKQEEYGMYGVLTTE